MQFKDRVERLIKQIPSGRVATYGQIAALAGSPRAALMVGRILRYSSDSKQLPWQRVINSKGEISIVNIEYPAELQAELLRQEGIKVGLENHIYRVNLGDYLWQPLDASTTGDTVNI